MSVDPAVPQAGPTLPSWPGRRRPQLSDEVAQHVRALIMSGAVPQGSFLRLEPLAHDLGISITPVREALASLEHQGFVRLEPRRGYVVSRFSRQDLVDVFMVEAFVAAELAERAARRITPERLGELHRVYDELVHLVNVQNYDEADNANFHFSWLVHDAAHSPKLSWLVSSIVPYSPQGYTSIEEMRDNIIEGFGAILVALDAGDPAAARRAMGDYVRRGGEASVRHFDQLGLWPDDPGPGDPDA